MFLLKIVTIPQVGTLQSELQNMMRYYLFFDDDLVELLKVQATCIVIRITTNT